MRTTFGKLVFGFSIGIAFVFAGLINWYGDKDIHAINQWLTTIGFGIWLGVAIAGIDIKIRSSRTKGK